MKRLRALLRSRKGMTLAELLCAMVLLSLAIALVAGLLPPLARTVRRMEDLNNAQVISGTILENIRGELELARGYIKCYSSDSPVGAGGSRRGDSIEFRTATGHVLLISARKCDRTIQRRPNVTGAGAAAPEIPAPEIPEGRLSYRYYNMESNGTYIFQDASGPVARAMEAVLGKGFYDVYRIGLEFSIAEDSRTVAVRVLVSRSDAPGEPVYDETLVVDLRYAPPLDTGITAAAG